MQDITGLYAVSLLLLAAVPLVRAGLEAGGGALRELAGGLCAAAARLLVLPSCPLRLTCGSAAAALLALKKELEPQAASAAPWAGIPGIAGSHAAPAVGSTVAVSVAFVQALLECHASLGAGESSDEAPPTLPALLRRKRAPVNIFQVLRKAHTLSSPGSSVTLGWPHCAADTLLDARPPMTLTLADADETFSWDRVDATLLCAQGGASLARPVAHATRKRRRAGNHEMEEGDALSEASRLSLQEDLALVELRPPLMGLRHLVEQERGSLQGDCWTAAQESQHYEAFGQKRREASGLSAAGTSQPPWAGWPVECEAYSDAPSSLDSTPSPDIALRSSCPASTTAAAPFAHAAPLLDLAAADPLLRGTSWREGFADGRPCQCGLGQPIEWRCGERSSSWQRSAADPLALPRAEDFQVAEADDCGVGLDWAAGLGRLTAAS